jgi:proteasome lid subunit RPN8/RPN11
MTITGEQSVILHGLAEEQVVEIVRQAEAGCPEEICGIVIGERGIPETYQVRQLRNVANQELQRDTAGMERDARTAYLADGRDQIRAINEAEKRGWEIVTLYHSHPDHDAYFSAMDRDRALWAGEPLWPGANYLVVSVRAGRARDARYYVWDEAGNDFAEVPAPLPAS